MADIHSTHVELDNRLVAGGLTKYSPDHSTESYICYRRCDIRCPNHVYLVDLIKEFFAEYSTPGDWELHMTKRIRDDFPVIS